MKFAFEIKTKPVTQASIIIAAMAFSSRSLALIAIYSQSLSQSLLRCCSGYHCVLGPPSCPLLMAPSAMIDDPEDEAAVVTAPPDSCAPFISSQGIPLVLQISSFPGSSYPDKIFYDPYTSLESRNFAAAPTFFIHHGHVVVYHDCPNAIAFQDLYPSAIIGYISLIPKSLLAEGRCILKSQQHALLK
jgi:hypothetical protein